MNKSLKFGFIGASKTGTNLAKYFKNHELQVSGFYSITHESAIKSAEITNTQAFSTIEELVTQSDIIFITVSDNHLQHMATIVCQALTMIKYDAPITKYLCHTSAAHSADFLEVYDNLTIYVGSLHPLYSFYDKKMDITTLQNALFVIEGDVVFVEMFKEIMTYLKNPFFVINKKDKVRYHLACVLLSSGVLSIISLVESLLANVKDFPIEELLKLGHSVLNNYARNKNIQTILTGPIKRQDHETISEYYKILDDKQRQFLDLMIDLLLPHV